MRALLFILCILSAMSLFAQDETIKVRRSDTLCKASLFSNDTSLFKYPIRVGQIIVEGISTKRSQKKIKKDLQVNSNELISIGQIQVNAMNVCHYEKFILDKILASRGKKNTTNIILRYVKTP